MATIQVAIAGATGYTGEELLRILLNHPHVRLTYLAASAKWDRPTPVAEVYPRFARLDLAVESLDPARLARAADIVFLALPHGTAMGLLPGLLQAGRRVIDLSGDFRLEDPDLYPAWYKFPHTQPALLRDRRTAYGLTEFHRDEIRQAQLVANPGCYATSILLAVLPLAQAGLLGEDGFIVDAKSGLSGAGRKPETALLFTEMSENVRAYRVNEHQHMPEVLQELRRVAGRAPRMVFVPQVLPITRGLVSTIYVRTAATAETVGQAYARAYGRGQAPFVRVRGGTLPEVRPVVGTNDCAIGYVATPALDSLVVGSALDNLTKGAAGQAVQNLNVMCGWPETTGLA
jgi:N-acetyl-gamma-glutamyl-phosphate reductase